MIDRILGLTGGGTATSLRALRILLLAHLVAETVVWTVRGAGVWSPALRWSLAIGYAIAFAAVWSPRRARGATFLASCLLSIQILATFPFTANHRFLLLVCAALLTLLDPDREEEAQTALPALRWVVVIVLLYTGVQKFLYGTYFEGQYLAWTISQGERFALFFAPLLPPDEQARLQSIGFPEPGAGPFRVDSLPFVILSNLVWILEIVLAVLLVPRSTRAGAACAAIVLFVLVEMGARELFFGLFFIALLITFFQRDRLRFLLPVWLAGYAVLVLVRLVFFPGWFAN